MHWIWLFLSWGIVAFGQPAGLAGVGVLAAALGYALFWKAMLAFPQPKERFFLSVIWFASVQSVQLSWFSTTHYMGPLILVVYCLVIVGLGVQFGLLSFFIAPPIGAQKAFAAAGFWVILEWLRLFVLCGFTWNPVGLALTESHFSLQFAAVWGVFGLSFWVIWANVLALNAYLRKTARSFAIWALVACVPYLFGLMHRHFVNDEALSHGTLRVALVQTALRPEQKEFFSEWAHAYMQPKDQWARIYKLLDPTKQVDLLVFPEATLPRSMHIAQFDLEWVQKYFDASYWPPLTPPYAKQHIGGWKVTNAFLVQALANYLNAHIIVGSDDADETGEYNAAFHFSPRGDLPERYEKRVLAPIAEYIPLRQWHKMAQFVAEEFGIYNSFDHGIAAKIFAQPCPIGVSICLEETFSQLIRELRQKGACLFVNLTNDAWFPGSTLPQQHFDHGRVRAAENGVCILRACNTGVTGVIDCFGAPLQTLSCPETEAGVLYTTVPLRAFKTLYTWWGDGAILGMSAAALLTQLRRKKKLP